MKIMHGMREVAGQAYYSVKGLRSNGYDAKLILWDESPLKYPYDECLMMVQGKKYMYPIYALKTFANFVKCAFKYDTYHFHFGHSLLPWNLDLPFLKLLKKNIFFEFPGSDVRQESIAYRMNHYWREVGLTNEERLRTRMLKLGKYAKAFIVHDDELLPHFSQELKPYIVPLRIEPERFTPEYPDPAKGKVTIVHAPSNRGVKGTKYIHSAVENLKKKYDIEYILVENMTQNEAFKEYQKADIIVDQILGGSYGVFSIEAMAMGKPVITYITDEMIKTFPDELPIVSASPLNIQEEIEKLINDGQIRHDLGVKGRKYIETYHDCKKNAKMIAKIYEGTANKTKGKDAFEEVKEL